MNANTVDYDIIATLTALIPTDRWIAPDFATFGHLLPGIGTTERAVSLRLRAALGLRAGPPRRNPLYMTIIGQPNGRDDIIVRTNCRMYKGDRYLWRRYAPGTDHAEIERDAAAVRQAVRLTPLLDGPRIEPVPLAPLPAPVTPPALPARPASTSIGRMPTPELQRLCADAMDELARRGDLPDPEPAMPATPAPLTDEIAWDFLRGRLSTDIKFELLRRIAADSAAAMQRHREAAQAEMEAARAALEAAQAKLAGLG
jgi:hypothetical protein